MDDQHSTEKTMKTKLMKELEELEELLEMKLQAAISRGSMHDTPCMDDVHSMHGNTHDDHASPNMHDVPVDANKFQPVQPRDAQISLAPRFISAILFTWPNLYPSTCRIIKFMLQALT